MKHYSWNFFTFEAFRLTVVKFPRLIKFGVIDVVNFRHSIESFVIFEDSAMVIDRLKNLAFCSGSTVSKTY